MTETRSVGKKLVGIYVYDGNATRYRDADAEGIDQMFYSFALLREGEVSVAHWQNFEKFRAYVQKHPNIAPILSVGGWGADGFSQAAASDESRAAFVANALRVMAENNFVGVDIDWEYPGSSVAGIQSSPNDRENYTLLLKALRSGLDTLTANDGVPRRLCVALSGAPDMTANIDCAAVGRIVDQVNLMTYDMQQSDTASHHAALYASRPGAMSAAACAQAYLDAGIPADKMMLGVAFYGHCWTTEHDDPLDRPATKKDTLPFAAIAKLIADAPDAMRYDDVAQAPYCFRGNTFISYDNERSITQKRNYAVAHRLLGLFAWEYGSLAEGSLIGAMRGADPANP